MTWTAGKTAAWITLSPTSGSIQPGANTPLTVTINSTANNLTTGNYSDTISFTNTVNNVGNTTRTVVLGVNIPHLVVSPSDTNVVLQWPTNAAAFSLQSSTNIGLLSNWAAVTPGPVVVSGQNTVTNTVSGMRKFFRLFH